MVDLAGRSFFKRLIREMVQSATTACRAGREEQKHPDEMDRFFASYESGYALTPCYLDDILLETAPRVGIPCEGREEIVIVKDLFRQKGELKNKYRRTLHKSHQQLADDRFGDRAGQTDAWYKRHERSFR